MKVRIHISLKNGVLDQQGKAIENSLTNLGFDKVKNVRQGKFIELDINEDARLQARKQATTQPINHMHQKVSNPTSQLAMHHTNNQSSTFVSKQAINHSIKKTSK